MNFIFGKDSYYKTTLLFQIAYNFILKSDNPNTNYSLILTSSNSSNHKNLLLGKYNTISANIIENIHIKQCNSFQYFQKYLLTLLQLDAKNFPIIILIDNIDCIMNIQSMNYKEEIYFQKKFNCFLNVFDLIRKVCLTKQVEIVISIDMDVNEIKNDEIIMLNGLLQYMKCSLNVSNDKDEVTCNEVLFEFDIKSESLFSWECVKLEQAKLKKMSHKDRNYNKNNELLLKKTAVQFENNVYNYLHNHN